MHVQHYRSAQTRVWEHWEGLAFYDFIRCFSRDRICTTSFRYYLRKKAAVCIISLPLLSKNPLRTAPHRARLLSTSSSLAFSFQAPGLHSQSAPHSSFLNSMRLLTRSHIIGVGMTALGRSGQSASALMRAAVNAALNDAGATTRTSDTSTTSTTASSSATFRCRAAASGWSDCRPIAR